MLNWFFFFHLQHMFVHSGLKPVCIIFKILYFNLKKKNYYQHFFKKFHLSCRNNYFFSTPAKFVTSVFHRPLILWNIKSFTQVSWSYCTHHLSWSTYSLTHSFFLESFLDEKPFKCSLCPKQFTQRANLKKHEMVHTGERPYQCPICKKAYAQYANMKKHMLVHAKSKQSV